MASNQSKYFSSALRNGLKRSLSEHPSSSLTLNDFYPCKKLRTFTPDGKLGSSPDINRLSEQLRQKNFFLKKNPPQARKSLFGQPKTSIESESRSSCKEISEDVDKILVPTDISPGGTVGSHVRLRSPQELPEQFRGLFSFRFFNIMQSSVLDIITKSSSSVVVSSPTGSGKTVTFELAIIREIMQGGRRKIIYLAPIKALITEKFNEWRDKFEALGISVLEYTGDFSGNDEREIREHDLILTTPEKWDVASRRKTHSTVPSLVMIDEVHLLSDEDRGHTLEAIITRIKLNHGGEVRFVAVSATIPNGEDIASWLNRGKYVYFSESKRPVPLKKIVYSYPKSESTNDFMFEMRLSYKLANLIRKFSNGKPTLIFTNTRKSSQTTANIVAKDLRCGVLDHLSYYAKDIHDSKLRDLIMRGVGYHHAGVEPTDRKIVEQLFAQGDLPILTCTTTLAQGVNLPAHLVIIKGTTQLVAGTTKEYDCAQVQQMIGRAGRPQFDTSATALILTKASNQKHYDNFMSGNHSTESCLHKRLAEHLNAEIVLGNIKTIEEAIKWAKITYLFVRIFKNPKFYNLTEIQNKNIESIFEELISKTLRDLEAINIISFKRGFLGSNVIGGVMARFNIAFKTMQNLNDTTGAEDIPGILSIFSLSEEYSNFILRRNEKEVLNKLNKPGKQKINENLRGIKYPFGSKIKTPSMKISVLIQASFDCLQISDPSLSREASMCIHVGQRISKAFMELLWNTSDPTKGFLLMNAITLAQCFQSGLWEDSPFVCKQFSRIGITYSTLLAQAGFTSFEKILSANARSIELATNRPPPFGNHLMTSASKMPRYALRFNEEEGLISIDLLNGQTEELVQDHGLFIVAYSVQNSFARVISKQRISDAKLPHSLRLSKSQLWNADELHVKLSSSSFCGLDLYGRYTLSSSSANVLSKAPSSEPVVELNQSFIDIDTMKVVVGKKARLVQKPPPRAITFEIDFDESMPDWDNDNLLEEIVAGKKCTKHNMSVSSSSFLSNKSLLEGMSTNVTDSSTDQSMLNADVMDEDSPQGKDTRTYSPYFQSSKVFMNISLEKRLGLI